MYKNIGEIAFQDLFKKESLRHSGSIFLSVGASNGEKEEKVDCSA
jgi:hypothetical protein